MATPLNSSVLKAFEILGLITADRSEISAATVASELGMNPGTAHRFLLSLEEAGALTSVRRGAFSIGPRIETLGRVAETVNPMWTRVQRVIDDISSELNESVMACRLGRNGPTCMAVSTADRPISVNIRVGTELPMTITAQGKLWLAMMSEADRKSWFKKHPGETVALGDPQVLERELASIRAAGISLNRGDNEPDIGAVAVPIFLGDGQMYLSISVFGMLSRFDDDLVHKAIELLKASADQLRSN